MNYKKVQDVMNSRDVQFRKQINKMAQEHLFVINLSLSKDVIIDEITNRLNVMEQEYLNVNKLLKHKDMLIEDLSNQLKLYIVETSENEPIDEVKKVPESFIWNNNRPMPQFF